TGEVLGIAKNFDDALIKGLIASGNKMKTKGGVLITVRNEDKLEVVNVAKKFADLGFELYATAGTASLLNKHMIATNSVRKISEPAPNVMTLFDDNKIDYIISTSSKGRNPAKDGVKIRRKAIEHGVVTLTALDTANAVARALKQNRSIKDIDLVDITTI
ncbi:MAG: carbamoyl-phosphate synthase large subunit, partial [Oscillospiraceae bacterium]